MSGGMPVSGPRSSLVIPVYGNQETIEPLVEAVEGIRERIVGNLEVIFVVDGSPDDSRERLVRALVSGRVRARVVEHSRNFGSFAAIRTGLSLARGEYIAVMAADLQEPPELVVEFIERLQKGDVDVVAGERASRDDRGDAFSKLYWLLYRRFVMSEIPVGGADVFACTANVRDVICSLERVHTSLITQLFWVGFRRQLVPYDRRKAPGESGWTLRRKLRYLSDSVFAFTDLPVRILWLVGLLGLVTGAVLAMVAVIAHAAGAVSVPGYTATILVIIFFGSFNMIGLGIIGSYVWRAYDTVKGRPGAIVREVLDFPAEDADG
jgi:glycosyltransferase involved in cell wall biosynthesis